MKIIKNKKAISEVVGYTLLIIMALGMAAGVYTFLKVYMPKSQPECPSDVSLIVQDSLCEISKNSLNLTLLNKGFFTVDGAYIWLNNKQINPGLGTNFHPNQPKPGATYQKVYSISDAVTSAGSYELKIEPLIFEKDKQIACRNAIITQTITCAP